MGQLLSPLLKAAQQDSSAALGALALEVAVLPLSLQVAGLVLVTVGDRADLLEGDPGGSRGA